MARTRNLKPGFFTNETLAEVNPLGRLLFQGLWCHADREGRLEDRPRRLKAEILPYDECDVSDLLDDLTAKGFISRYQGQDGNSYIQILSFCKHQNPHVKEPASSIPAPDGYELCTRQAQNKNSSSRALTLNPSTLNEVWGTDAPGTPAANGPPSACLKYISEYPETSHTSSLEEVTSAWRGVCRNGNDELKIILSLRAHKACGQWDDPRFIPSPANFLKKKYFDREVSRVPHLNGTGPPPPIDVNHVDPEIARIKALAAQFDGQPSVQEQGR